MIDATWTSADGVEGEDLRSDGQSVHRYWIERRWSDAPGYLLWVMFNPSTATPTADKGDRALALCIRRTKLHAARHRPDVGALRIVNLFARRGTVIAEENWPCGDALNHPAWIGHGNDEYILAHAAGAAATVVGWGPSLLAATKSHWRAEHVLSLLHDPLCVGVTDDGVPRYTGRTMAGLPTDIPLVRLADAPVVRRVGGVEGRRDEGSDVATYYVKFGDEKRRLWADAKRYGFVSGGGGPRWSNPLRRLTVGDEVLVHVPGAGYVGRGRVVTPAKPIRDVTLEVNGQTVPMLDAPLVSPRIHDNLDNADCEYVVRVEWLSAVNKEQGYWRPRLYWVRGSTAYPFENEADATEIREHL